MTIDWVLKAYFSTSALLLITSVLFAWADYFPLSPRLRSSYQYRLRIGQVLIVLSLILPAGFRAIPEQRLPSVAWMSFRPISESFNSMDNRPILNKKSGAKLSSPHLQAPQPPQRWDEWLQQLELEPSYGIIFLLVAGMAFCCGRLLWTTRNLKKVLSTSVSIRQLGHVRVSVSESVLVPFSVRIWRKCWVVVPSFILENASDLRISIRHELQHHRQGDTLWAWVMETVHCVFFLNPGAYLWKKKINELQELSCDEALIGQMKVSLHDYGSCLVRVAEAALGSHARYAGTTCLASISRNPFHVKSFLRRRVEMFSKHGMLGSTRWIGAVLGTVAVSATVALAFGAEQSFRKINTVNPGTLVVDPAIQVIADKVLAKAIEKEKAKAGFAIVADPNTGRILAVSNIDTVNPRQGHWALSYELEQASFFKSLVAAHAMEQGLTSRQEKHACENGTYLYNGRVYHDWKKGGWDALSTEETILNSSDICSMKIGEKIGPSGLVKMLENFGFGPNGTAQKLPEAKVGELPIAEDPLDLVPFAVSGFGFKSTPVEMLQAYGAIANGGKLMMPQSADQIDSQVVRRVLSAESAREAKEILRQVVLRGTGKPAQSRIYTTAGKTATAWTASYLDWMNGKHGDFAGFIGFAPVDAPRVEIYVGIRDPESHDGAHGSHHAGPVFKELVEEVLQFMNVAPDRPQS